VVVNEHIEGREVMIEERQAKVYYSPSAGRRFLTKRAAIRAEARALIEQRYPTERSEYDDRGMCEHPGWHWHLLDNSEKLYRRVCRLVKSKLDSNAAKGN
jgi:hypothetical protein